MKSLRCYRMRSLDGIEISAAIVNSLTPISATTTQTPLDKILNNFYTDTTNQIEIVNKIYDMLQYANNNSRTTPLPSVLNYNDVKNRIIVIKYFLSNYVQNDITFLNLMDELINTNWVIDTRQISGGGPLKEYYFNLTDTDSYTLLNNLVDFYDNNKNILETDKTDIKMLN
jgi:hypothetical protein